VVDVIVAFRLLRRGGIAVVDELMESLVSGMRPVNTLQITLA